MTLNADANVVRNEILLEYLKLLREEMHIRLNKHYTLTISKLVGVATVLSFLLTNPDRLRSLGALASACYLLAPALAITFDFQIANNLKWMNTTGTFIRDRIESFFADEFKLPLYESEALGFRAYLSRIIEIGLTSVMVVFGGVQFLLASTFDLPGKLLALGPLLALSALSGFVMIDSVRGFTFKKRIARSPSDDRNASPH